MSAAPAMGAHVSSLARTTSNTRRVAGVAAAGGAFLVNKLRGVSSKRASASAPRSRRSRRALALTTASSTVVVGDIGGTNARLQVWNIVDGAQTLKYENIYGTKGHETFESVISDLYRDAGVDPSDVHSACFAVAGPVANDACAMTNVSWVIDGAKLEKEFKIDSVKVINDFAAVGYGVLDLKPEEMVTLNPGSPDARGPIAVLGPGTGLGEAMLFWNDEAEEHDVIPSEGSHADFAPRGETQSALLAYCERTLGECEIEQVCCGSGIVRIYDFLRERRGAADKPELDPAGVTDAALDGSCPLCVEAVDIFLAILGAEAGNLALKCLASGGVYVAGGIPPRLTKLIGDGGTLLDAYVRKSCRYTNVRSGFPLHIILNDKIGLAGAKVFALRQL